MSLAPLWTARAQVTTGSRRVSERASASLGWNEWSHMHPRIRPLSTRVLWQRGAVTECRSPLPIVFASSHKTRQGKCHTKTATRTAHVQKPRPDGGACIVYTCMNAGGSVGGSNLERGASRHGSVSECRVSVGGMSCCLVVMFPHDERMSERHVQRQREMRLCGCAMTAVRMWDDMVRYTCGV